MDNSRATLEAFYARVINRVCHSYQQSSDAISEADTERLQQKWQEKLDFYTGEHKHSSLSIEEISNTLSTVASAESGSEVFNEESEVLMPCTTSHSFVVSDKEVVGRPNAQLQPTVVSSTNSSIFSRMLGSKRKLHQLDGTVLSDEEWQDSDVQEQRNLPPPRVIVQEACVQQKDYVDSKIENYFLKDDSEEKEDQDSAEIPVDLVLPLLVSENDFSPVSGISGINLPLQIAAAYSKFVHRGKRRGYIGRLHAIVLTWPCCLTAKEPIHFGDLLWCWPNAERGYVGEGELVKVIAVQERLHELTIRRSDGSETIVQLRQVCRLKEYLIRKGTVRLRSEHNQ